MVDSILIIGGTGYIGNKLAIESLNQGYEVTIISLNKPVKAIVGASYIQVDITDRAELKKVFKFISCNYVINLSGYVDHSNFKNGGIKVIDTHFNGLQNVLDLIDWNNLKKFIQIGSSEEYGSQPAPQNESTEEEPLSPYSFAKVSSTSLLKMLYKVHKFPVVILRLFLVYGPDQENNRFLPQVINGCLQKKSFPVSEGKQMRDFCYIDDVISAILMTLNNNIVLGEVLNIASGNSITIRKIVSMINQIIGYGKPEFGAIPYRENENMELYANIEKANRLLKWRPKISIEEGIARTIASYKEGKDFV